ncbi:MAG: hypothetical protein Q9174_004475 [Haloplaca sp. 1 TL-2023]
MVSPGGSYSLFLPYLPCPPSRGDFVFRLPSDPAIIVALGKWGAELPNFDDVIQVIENAQAEIARATKSGALEKQRGWNFQSAHLVIENTMGIDGITYGELGDFLRALRFFGELYGFFTCQMTFYNRRKTLEFRGNGLLEIAPPPRGLFASTNGTSTA